MSNRKAGLMMLFVLALLAVWVAPVAAQGSDPGKLVLGGTYTLSSGQQLQGDLGVVGGMATVEEDATVNGDVMVAGGTLRVAGRINGDIAVFGGAVTLERSAYVDGDLVNIGGSVQRSAGATVTGDVREGDEFELPMGPGPLFLPGMDRFTPGPEVNAQQSPGQWLALALLRMIRTVIMILALAALALVVALLWPRGIERLGTTAMHQPVLVVLVGLMSWVVGLGLFVVLMVTFCLIPIALLLALVLAAAALLSWVVAGWLVGRKLLAVLNLRNATVVIEAVVGTLVLAVIYFLFGIIPCTEFIVGLLIVSLGLGAIVLTRFGTRPYPVAAATAAPLDDQAALPAGDEPQPPQLTGR